MISHDGMEMKVERQEYEPTAANNLRLKLKAHTSII